MTNDPARLSLLWETIQEEEAYPIFRLAYLSEPTRPFTDEDFDDIEQKSIVANNKRDVTGILIVDGDRILQVLEGQEEAVRALYTKIEADPRHTVTKLVCAVEDGVRLLMTWSMVVRGLEGAPTELLDEFSDAFDDLRKAPPEAEISMDHIDLFKAIAVFRPATPAV